MIAFWLLIVCAACMAVAQDAFPGKDLYHYGWYNALDIALFVLAALQLRGRSSSGSVVAAFGAGIVVFAAAASGLMGPDTQTIVGAPGATIRNDDVGGSFAFPLQAYDAPVVLQRGNGSTTIGGGRRYSGGFVFWQTARAVVVVDAADVRGNHLTMTQPANATFLSPVLLMQQATTIAGMNVRYDTFSVPALGRSVKAVLFSEEQAAQLRSNPPIRKPAVLFAVSGSQGRVLPGGIGLVASGDRKRIDDLLLGAQIETYPAIMAASAPYFPVLVAGLAVLAAGIVWTVARS